MTAFLIVGLPRSKTAWMSVVASMVPGSICHHEPVTRFKRWECCFDIWKNPSAPHIGIADSGLGFHLERILAEVAPRVLIIRRDPRAVKESLARLNPIETNYVDLLSETLDRFTSSPGVLSVAFEELDHPDVVAECLQHLIPGGTLDSERISELIKLNIQTDMERMWKFAAAARPEKLVGPDVLAKLRVQ